MKISLFTLFVGVTIPAPVPYDEKWPHRNQENLSIALLNLLTKLSTLDLEIGDISEVTALVQAVNDLQYQTTNIEMGAVEVNEFGLLVEHA